MSDAVLPPGPEAAPRRSRDRRARGMRGPAFGRPVPAARSRRERFDDLALSALDEVRAHRPEELGDVELAVEDCPVLPRTWVAPRVPLATMVGGAASSAPRLVLFRRPLEHRAEGMRDLEPLVLRVVVEQLADYLGVHAEDLHPDYEP